MAIKTFTNELECSVGINVKYYTSKPVYTVKQKVNKSRKDTQNAIYINK